MMEQNLCVLRNVIGSHIIATYFLKINLRTFGFALGPWAIYSQVLGHHAMSVWAASHGVGLKWNQILVGYAHGLRATNALAYCAGRDTVVDQVTSLVFNFLF